MEGAITIVAPTNHLFRTRRIAQGFGMDIDTIEAEKVVDIPVPKVRLYERILRPLSLIDPEGRIPRIITRRRLRS